MVLALAGCVRDIVFGALQQPLFADVTPVPATGSASASACGGCHADIAAEWRTSRMSSGWTDPLFQADYEEQGRIYACLYCHTPLVEQRETIATGLASLSPVRAIEEPNPRYDPALREEGVTCLACHLDGDAIAGPFATDLAPHRVKHDPDFASADRCVGCHQADAPPFSRVSRPVADTHGEWARWKSATGGTASCADCHMPAVTRSVAPGAPERAGRRHTFAGAWDAEFVRSAVEVREFTRVGEQVTFTLVNLAGHNFPTAEPMRALRVEGCEPLVLAREIDTARWIEGSDTTLRPGEARRLELRACRAQLRLVFDRVAGASEGVRAAAGEAREVVIWEEGG